MKQFIVLVAILPFLLIFPVQFSKDQISASRLDMAADRIEAACEKAKQEGCFTVVEIADLKADIASIFDIEAYRVKIEATGIPVYRRIVRGKTYPPEWERQLIHYKISIPLDEVMAGGLLLNLSAEENSAVYTFEGTVPSERLAP